MVKATTNGVSQKERGIIEGIVCNSPDGLPICLLVERVKKLVKNITMEHYIYIGYCMGVIQGTHETSEQFHKQNNPLSKCRLN